jgi:hypothetical protein
VRVLVKPDKSRYVYLYLPSAKEKALWDDLAKKAGVPPTKFVIEIVENALADDVEFKPRGELSKEISALRKEVKISGMNSSSRISPLINMRRNSSVIAVQHSWKIASRA